MAVPTHDQRDWDFATKYGIAKKIVIQNADNSLDVTTTTGAYVDDGVLVNSGSFDGMANREAIKAIIADGAEKGYAEAVAYSDNGSINGNWKHCKKMLSSQNGGHGMIFKDLNDEMRFTMHFPNSPFGAERAKIFFLEDIKEEPFLKMRD
jgi:hypothetical protein